MSPPTGAIGPKEEKATLNSRKPLVLIAAAVVAVIAVFILYQFVTGQKNKAFNDAKMVKVWTVHEMVPKGTYGQKTVGLIVQDEIPKKFFPSNAITSRDQITNKVAVTDLAVNSIVVDGNFADPDTQAVTLSTQLKQIHGVPQVAVTINVNNVQGVAGLIVPGDFVNIMVTGLSASDLSGGDGGGGAPPAGQGTACGDAVIPPGQSTSDFLFCQQTRVLYQKVEVLAVGDNAIPTPGQVGPDASSTTKNSNTGLLTFIVPMKSAQMIASVTPGHFYLTLVSEDYRASATGKIKPNDPLPSEDPKVLTPYGPTGPT